MSTGSIESVVGGGSPPFGPAAELVASGAVALLHCLLAGSEDAADLGPGQPVGARFGDEAPDQRVADVGQLAPNPDRFAQAACGRLLTCALRDERGEVIDRGEAGWRHASSLG